MAAARGGPTVSAMSHRTLPSHTDAVYGAAVTACSDPEAAAILVAIREKCHVVPRSGVGLTAVESLGEIRQTIRVYADKRAAEVRHRAKPGDMAEPETAEDMRRLLCSLVTRLADKMGGHVDCFCGRCPVASETVLASFRDRYQVTPGVLVVLAAFVESYSGGSGNGGSNIGKKGICSLF